MNSPGKGGLVETCVAIIGVIELQVALVGHGGRMQNTPSFFSGVQAELHVAVTLALGPSPVPHAVADGIVPGVPPPGVGDIIVHKQPQPMRSGPVLAQVVSTERIPTHSETFRHFFMGFSP